MIRKPLLTLAALLAAAGLFAGCAAMNNGARDGTMTGNGVNDDGTFGTRNVRNWNGGDRFRGWTADEGEASARNVARWMEQRLAQAGFVNSDVLVLGDNIFVIEGTRVDTNDHDGVLDSGRNVARDIGNVARDTFRDPGDIPRDAGNIVRDTGNAVRDTGNAFMRNGRRMVNNLFGRGNGSRMMNDGRIRTENVSALAVLMDEFSGMRVYRVTSEEGKQALRRLERSLSTLTAGDTDTIANDIRTLIESVTKVNGTRTVERTKSAG